MMLRHPTARVLATATALVALGAVSACSDGAATSADPQRIDVAAAFYPLQFIAERVGGDAVRVTNLTKPGAEPHDLELTPSQVGEVNQAELVVYLKGFQPAVDEAIAQSGGDRAFDVAGVQPLLAASAGGHEHEGEGEGEEEHAEEGNGGKDPHLWLDPTRLAGVADQLAERLGKADPERAADYTARAKTLRADLEKLDAEFAAGLKTCQRREIVVSHTAFGYLAERYKLEQVGITGLTPENEPSPQRLAEVTKEAREHGATTIFFETLVSPKVAETIAREVGAKTAVLDPLEGLTADGNGQDYLSVMRTNLQTLRTALSCS
ncbi:metal ABC transporter substrate-binding protein [Micromonospora sp. ATCC 39149]|uniref:Zinc ABC transporter substrate-binding protein n=1 Tax=Micromonospora carbonacea TaxID=47853 RepID=A0A7D5Y796_9ACTN|nr:metal ABC transporter substrate-binding protein [Micromonospora sp. ATCC 39149]QLJ97479.1 zinc ABC transporter substrate-binding protein [Micromonospora carbonacea]